MIINERFEEPYNKFPPDGPLPSLSKSIITSKLSKKFWDATLYIHKSNSIKNKNQSYPIPFLQKESKRSSFQKKINTNCFNIKPEIKEERINKKDKYSFYTQRKSKSLNKHKNNKKYKDDKETFQLKQELIILENDINKKNIVINRQKELKDKLLKRIDQLEKLLNNFFD